MKKFNSNTLLQNAITETGLSDFGNSTLTDDFCFFIDTLNKGNSILDERWDKAYEYILNLLVNRLRMCDDLKKFPEIQNIELKPPIIILSLPRTGTTKLQRLLGSTGNFQNLLYWHTHMPARLPGEANGGIKERISSTRKYEQWCIRSVPDYHLGHPILAEEPEEDVHLTNMSFRSVFLPAIFDIPEYLKFLATADFTPAFECIRDSLKYLQWQFYSDNPKGWFLKSPGHLGLEQHYQHIFPQGMKIIFNHRNLAEVIPSSTKTGEILSTIFSKPRSRVDYGQTLISHFSNILKTHMSWRDSNPQIQILDLSYKEIRDDSIGTAEKVYDFLGLNLSTEVRQQITHWDRENPTNKHGKNVHNLTDSGVSQGMIDEAFTDYHERFGAFL